MAEQEVQVQQKREVEKKRESTVPLRAFLPVADIFETDHALKVVVEMPGVDKANVDTELLQRLGEQGPGAAVEIGRRHDVVACLRDVEYGEGRRRLPRRNGKCAGSAFESRESFLKGILGGIFNAGIDLAELFERE